MMRTIAGTALTAWACSCSIAYAQADAKDADTRLAFEVASVRPAAPMPPGQMTVGSRGGPGTNDPGRITYTNVTIINLLLRAYDVKYNQISGGPGWLENERFDINVKVPPGATREQVKVMLQHLLASRFRLAVHREKKEMPIYALVVGKNGPRMREAKPGAPPPVTPDPTMPLQTGSEGCPDLSAMANRQGSMMAITNGNACLAMSGQPMSKLANMLSEQLDRPVVEMTGLDAKYDFLLRFDASTAGKGMTVMTGVPVGGQLGGDGSRDGAGIVPGADANAAPGILAAVQQQLGLKLEPRKGPVEVLVIDHVEKTPTEN
jgi:uncharacterized protein (TIGR03435 family)